MGFLRSWMHGLVDVARDPTKQKLVSSVVALIVTGTVVYSVLEGWPVVDALYFSVVTLTTVGYGDLTPQTVVGKLFTIVYVLAGISLIIAFANTVFRRAAIVEPRRQPDQTDRSDYTGEAEQ